MALKRGKLIQVRLDHDMGALREPFIEAQTACYKKMGIEDPKLARKYAVDDTIPMLNNYATMHVYAVGNGVVEGFYRGPSRFGKITSGMYQLFVKPDGLYDGEYLLSRNYRISEDTEPEGTSLELVNSIPNGATLKFGYTDSGCYEDWVSWVTGFDPSRNVWTINNRRPSKVGNTFGLTIVEGRYKPVVFDSNGRVIPMDVLTGIYIS